MVVKGSNLPSPVTSPKPAADPQTHQACWQEKVPSPSSEPQAGNILLAQIPFPASGRCFDDCIFSVCFWLRAQNLLAACRGFWCCSQNPARKLLARRSPCASREIQQLWLKKYCRSTDLKYLGSHLTSPPWEASCTVLPTTFTSPQRDKHRAVTCHLCNSAAKIQNS